MIELRTLRLEGFFGIGEAEIDLGGQGLVLVAGTNGSGKTALVVEGLYYALYGQSFEYGKNPGESVVNRRLGRMLVEVRFRAGESVWTVRRARNHPQYRTSVSLLQEAADGTVSDRTLGTAAATQASLESVLGMTAEGFASSVVFSTDLLRFPDYPDAEKKRVIEGLLHLSAVDVARDRVKDERVILGSRAAVAASALAGVEREFRTLAADLEALEAAQPFSEASLAQLEELRRSLSSLKEDERAVVEAWHALPAQLDAARQEEAAVRQEQERVLAALRGEEAEFRDREARARRLAAGAVAELRRENCPTCLRLWGEDHKQELRDKLEKYRQAAADSAAASEEVEEEIRELARPFAPRIAAAGTRVRELGLEEKALGRRAGEVGRELQRTQERLRTLEAEKARRDGVMEERADRIRILRERLADAKDRAMAAEDAVAAAELELADLQILGECFGPSGARVLLLQSAIPALNAAAADAADLIAPGIDVRFAADAATRGRIEIAVDNAHGAAQYHGNSGGERRRVDLVVMFALMRMSRTRMDVLVVDEAFEKLSEDSQALVAAYLRSLVREIPSIFMINHTALSLAGSADQVWTMDRGRLESVVDLRR